MCNEDPDRNVISLEMKDRTYLTQSRERMTKIVVCELGNPVALRMLIFPWRIN